MSDWSQGRVAQTIVEEFFAENDAEPEKIAIFVNDNIVTLP